MRKAAAVVPLVLGLLAVAACASRPPTVLQTEPSRAAPESPRQSQAPPILTISPAPGSKMLPVSTEIGTRVSGGTLTAVTLVEAGGAAVPGRMRHDGTAWVPDRPLRYGRTYTASVTARSAHAESTRTTTFTTMRYPGRRVGTGLYLLDGVTYGVAMPVVVEFDTDIPVGFRAGIERRLFVSTDPPQPGAWGWFGARQVLYRAPQFWRPGTALTVRVALDGHPMGDNRYGDTDRRATARISWTRTEVVVDNATKRMQVYQDDRLVRIAPVSLGKPATPSSSGTMVVMDKQVTTVFNTRDDPDPANRYVIDIQYAQRLTWAGEFIHAAPWSVRHQGVRNVSHGCVNLSTADARWLFSATRIGDPVMVRGTERRVDPGNGWTAWDLTWPDFRKRSALPA